MVNITAFSDIIAPDNKVCCQPSPSSVASASPLFNKFVASSCVFVYRISTESHCQVGVCAGIDLEYYLNGTLKRHEGTLLKCMKSITLDNNPLIKNPVMVMYKEQQAINEVVSEIINAAPADIRLCDDGVHHDMWVISDTTVISQLQSAFQAVESLYLADGHHRLASLESATRNRRHSSASSNSVINYFDNEGSMLDEDIIIELDCKQHFAAVLFPDTQLQLTSFHRILPPTPSVMQLTANLDVYLASLSRHFYIKEITSSVQFTTTKHTLNLMIAGRWFELVVKRATLRQFTTLVKLLDVNIMQELILNDLLAGQPVTDSITYVSRSRMSVADINNAHAEGRAHLVVCSREVTVRDVMDIADAGCIMPPKASSFEPKILDETFSKLQFATY